MNLCARLFAAGVSAEDINRVSAMVNALLFITNRENCTAYYSAIEGEMCVDLTEWMRDAKLAVAGAMSE